MKQLMLAVLIALPAVAQQIAIDDTLTTAQEIHLPVRYEGLPGAVAVELKILFARHRVQVEPEFSWPNGDRVSAPGWINAWNIKPGPGDLDTLHVAAATAEDSIVGSGTLFSLRVTILDPLGSPLLLDLALLSDDPVAVKSGSVARRGHSASLAGTTTLLQGLTGRHNWRQPLQIRLQDDDLTGSAAVLVRNITTGQAFNVALDAPAYAANLLTVPGYYGNTEALGVSPGDQVEVVYWDSLTAAGTERLVIHPVEVMTAWGDTNEDGRISLPDVVVAMRIAVGRLPYSPLADVTGTGEVLLEDALAILRWAVGLQDRFLIYDRWEE